MKKILCLVSLLLITTSCAAPGKSFSTYDKFTGTNSHYMTLGKVRAKGSNIGLIQENVVSIAHDDNTPGQYYFIISIYQEGSDRDCTVIKKGNEVIFLSKSCRFITKAMNDPRFGEMRPGLLSPSCHEQGLKVGPFSKEDLMLLTDEAHSVEFKLYGNHYHLESALYEEQIKLIRQFISAKQQLEAPL